MKQKLAQLSDYQLLKMYKTQPEPALLGELYKRYSGFVFLISMKYLRDKAKSEDSVMQIFEKLFSDISKHEIENFKSWLHVVTKNHCFQMLRNEQREQKRLDDLKNNSAFFVETDDWEHHTQNKHEELENRTIELHEAIKSLKKEQAECVKLFYLENKSYQEISEITGYSVKNVKSHIQNGKRNLKNKLSQINFIFWIILSGISS